jgi:hypothetical protein
MLSAEEQVAGVDFGGQLKLLINAHAKKPVTMYPTAHHTAMNVTSHA